jgi:hypothetical protein
MEKIVKCPLCTTELTDTQQQLMVQKHIAKLKEIERINKEITDKNQKLNTQVEELTQTIQKLQLQLKKYEHIDDVKIQELLNQLTHPLIIEAIKNIIDKFDQQPNNQITPDNQDDSITNESQENINEDKETNKQTLENIQNYNSISDNYLDLTPLEQELVNNYNNPNYEFGESIIIVYEAEESQNKRWSGSKERTVFKQNRKGNYWVVIIEDFGYIFPQRKLHINEHSQDTLISSFDCRSYQSGKSENFVLIKPGKVTAKNQDGWQLIEPGILQF